MRPPTAALLLCVLATTAQVEEPIPETSWFGALVSVPHVFCSFVDNQWCDLFNSFGSIIIDAYYTYEESVALAKKVQKLREEGKLGSEEGIQTLIQALRIMESVERNYRKTRTVVSKIKEILGDSLALSSEYGIKLRP